MGSKSQFSVVDRNEASEREYDRIECYVFLSWVFGISASYMPHVEVVHTVSLARGVLHPGYLALTMAPSSDPCHHTSIHVFFHLLLVLLSYS